MIKLNDIWGEYYYNPDGSINSECRLFAGWTKEAIELYLHNNI